jgi:hypothetical protein
VVPPLAANVVLYVWLTVADGRGESVVITGPTEMVSENAFVANWEGALESAT